MQETKPPIRILSEGATSNQAICVTEMAAALNAFNAWTAIFARFKVPRAAEVTMKLSVASVDGLEQRRTVLFAGTGRALSQNATRAIKNDCLIIKFRHYHCDHVAHCARHRQGQVISCISFIRQVWFIAGRAPSYPRSLEPSAYNLSSAPKSSRWEMTIDETTLPWHTFVTVYPIFIAQLSACAVCVCMCVQP